MDVMSSPKNTQGLNGASSFLSNLSMVPQMTLPNLIHHSLIRGAPARVLFDGLGKHWRSSKGTDETFALSATVEEIDDFLSHNWSMAGWRKLLSLCFLLNSLPAFVASTSASALAALLQARAVGALPCSLTVRETFAGEDFVYFYGWWPLAFGAATHVVFFLFWQEMRAKLEGPLGLKARMMFLDKVCIHQTDLVMKDAAVAGLAGILRHSKRLVILWGPQYLSRLWCVYEVASWMHLKGDTEGTTVFIPAGFAVGMVIYAFLHLVGYIVNAASLWQLPNLMAIFNFVAMALLAGNFARSQRQLQEFDISNTECHCCSVMHRDPETGKELMCQRQKVYATIRDWFPGPAFSTQANFGQFNEQIRNNWGRKVLRSSGNHHLVYQMGLAVSCPRLWDTFCRLDILTLPWVGHATLFVAYNIFVALVLLPSALWLFVWMSCWASTLQLGEGRSATIIRTSIFAVGILCPAALLVGYELLLPRLPPGAGYVAARSTVMAGAFLIFAGCFLKGQACFRRCEREQGEEDDVVGFQGVVTVTAPKNQTPTAPPTTIGLCAAEEETSPKEDLNIPGAILEEELGNELC